MASSSCPASSRSLTYSGANYVASKTDEEGRQTTYLRDASGKETSRTEAVGTPVARTITTTWNPNFPLPATITEPGLTTAYTYDTAGNVLTKTLTDTTSITVPYATNGRTRVWTYSWTPTGRLLTVDGPLTGAGDKIAYTYDSSGYLSTVTNEVGKVTTVSAVNGRGQPLTVVDPNGVTSTFTYDIDGHPLTATVNPGSSQSLYQFAYNAVGDVTKVTLPGGGYLQYAYDDARRLTSITNDRAQVVAIGSDLNRDVTSKVVKTTATGTTTAQQTYAYDELGRLLKSIGAAGATQTTAFAYDKVDNQKAMTDARTKVWGTTFDALDRVTKQTDPENHTVQYGYAANDQLTSHIDGNALQTTRVVDGFGQTIQETSPDRGVRKYWYDAAGRLTKLVDGDSEETDYAYDNAGRLTTKTFPAATYENQTYTYDQVTGGNKGVGRLTHLVDESMDAAFTYDAQGRLILDSRAITSGTYAVAYAYDVNGRVTQITYPSGRIVTITRASDGLATGVTTKPTSAGTVSTLASAITYKPFGPLASLTYGNGLALTNTYDLNYWLTRAQVAATGATRLDLSYSRDGTGALNGVTDNASSGRGATYGYWDSGRLQYAIGPWGEWDYTYDGAGNLIERDKVVGGTKTYNLHYTATGTNRIAEVADVNGNALRTLTYRTGGDLYQDQVVGGDLLTYSPNVLKRPVVVQRNGWTQAEYGYNGFGQRVWRKAYTVFGMVTGQSHYVYDQDGRLLAEHDASTHVVLREYVWLDDQLLAQVDSTASPVKTYFVHAGQIGEPLVMTDSTKAKVWDGFVDPYGIAQTFTTATATIDLRLPGQWQMGEIGPLYQNGMREYDPTLARYIETDPLGLDAGQNVYAYVDGRPNEAIDPNGLGAMGGAIGGAIGGGVAGVGGAETGPGEAVIIPIGRIVGSAAGSALEDALSHSRPQPICAVPNRPSTKKMRRQWSDHHQQEWPEEPKEPGKPQQVSHIKARADGGGDDLDNYGPKPRADHLREHMEAGDFSRWGKLRNK